MQTLYYIGLDVHMSYCVKDTCDRVYGRRFSSSHRLRSGSMDENTSAAVDRGDGSHGVYRMDLPSFAATCCGAKGSASGDAADHCGRKKRSYRRQQDLRLPAQ